MDVMIASRDTRVLSEEAWTPTLEHMEASALLQIPSRSSKSSAA